LLVKPNKGGTPAKLIKIKTTNIEIEGILPINFNSFNVLTYLISKIKNMKNILNNKNM
jgi:hypothetical protein